MSALYLYDFDGTLTTKDSLFAFLKFATPRGKYILAVVSLAPLLVLAKLGLISKAEAKRKLISACLIGKSKTELSSLAIRFFKKIKDTPFFREKALVSIENNKGKGKIYIVSASVDIWMEAIAKNLGVGLICTQADFKNDIFSGNFKTPNCNYEEKPKRVLAEIDLNNFSEINYFGDSKGDMAMKSLATAFYLNYFK